MTESHKGWELIKGRYLDLTGKPVSDTVLFRVSDSYIDMIGAVKDKHGEWHRISAVYKDGIWRL